jgi:DnaJ homolog subfamily A member 2
MPSYRHHDYGNLYIQFDVKFPETGEMQNLALLERVLPPRQTENPPPLDAMVEDFELEEVDPRGQARAQGATGLDDEDEDGIPQGAERMQCASQ